MTPASAAMPWPTDIEFPPEINGVAVGPRGSAVFSGWVNATGHPAISIPGPTAGASLPIGIQFVADFGEDALLLQIAKQIEEATSWHTIWPELAR